MRTNTQEMIRLGDLVVAAFDDATHSTSDPKEVSRLAIQTVRYLLRAARRTWAPLPPSVVSNTARHSGKQAMAGVW